MNSKIEILYFITLEMLNYILALGAVLCAKSLQSCLTLCNPMGCSLTGSLSMGFSKQEYWGGLPCPPPGDLSDPGI